MGYILNEPKTFINIKLTDVGRRQLSLGSLRFTSAVLSDREINYGIDRTEKYDISKNRILSPLDTHPSFVVNFEAIIAGTETKSVFRGATYVNYY